MKRWRTSLSIVAGLTLLALLTVAPVAAAPPSTLSPPPPTLSGETLTVPTTFGAVACNAIGSFAFTVSGTATGPYPGTFTEQVTGEVTGTPGNSQLTAFSATFTINATSGPTSGDTVTGTKSFSGSPVPACYQDAHNVSVLGTVQTTYRATIATSHGKYTDQGTSSVTFFTSQGTANIFSETFTSSQQQPALVVPTSKDQCKDGGWQTYGIFKNQGDCVSFVATGGKNPPSGS